MMIVDCFQIINYIYPDHGMLEIGINVKKTVKHPNLNVLFSSLVTPETRMLGFNYWQCEFNDLAEFTCQVRVNSHQHQSLTSK